MVILISNRHYVELCVYCLTTHFNSEVVHLTCKGTRLSLSLYIPRVEIVDLYMSLPFYQHDTQGRSTQSPQRILPGWMFCILTPRH